MVKPRVKGEGGTPYPKQEALPSYMAKGDLQFQNRAWKVRTITQTASGLLMYMTSCDCRLFAKLCPTLLLPPTDWRPPGSSVHGISQARTLKGVAISFSRGSSQTRDQTHVSALARKFFITEPPGSPHKNDCSIAKSRLTLCDPIDCGRPGLLVFHYLLEFAQVRVHWIGDAIQPSHPLPFSSSFAFSLSQHQGLLQWVSC